MATYIYQHLDSITQIGILSIIFSNHVLSHVITNIDKTNNIPVKSDYVIGKKVWGCDYLIFEDTDSIFISYITTWINTFDIIIQTFYRSSINGYRISKEPRNPRNYFIYCWSSKVHSFLVRLWNRICGTDN